MTTLGIASSDWAHTMSDKNGHPVMGGSGWIRVGQYLDFLNFDQVHIGRLAHKANTGEMLVNTWDDEIKGGLDVLLMQRYMIGGLLEDLKSSRTRTELIIIQDIDDWYWGLSPQNHAWKATNPKLSPDNNIDWYKKIIGQSDLIITSTPYLADRLSTFFPSDKIVVHENHVNFSLYTPRIHTEGERPRVGWFGSTAHRSGDLEILRGVLSQVEPSFGFVHVGDMVPHHSPFHEGVGIKEESMVERLPLLTPDDLYVKGFNYDIGIVPLKDLPFNSAKSWIKGLEYAAAGVPFIASPSPEYRRMNEEYGVGRLASRPKDWLRHIKALRDPELRQEEARQNREAMLGLDVRIGAQSLEIILKSLL